MGLTSSVALVAPEMFAPEALLQMVPPFVETSHWIPAAEQFAGTAPSLTLKLAPAGAVTDWSTGCSATAGEASQGGGSTVSVAAWLSVSPWAFVSTTRN